MAQRTCSVPTCGRDAEYLLYCRPHYRRWRATGDADPDRPLKIQPTAHEVEDVVARILGRCESEPTGCLTWIGPLANGYASIRWRKRKWPAHRAIWTALRGPIPSDGDWTIDHLCRNRACQNVEHMEVVTRLENSRRGGGLEVAQAKNRTRHSCSSGHRYTPENTYRSNAGFRMCKACKLAAWHKRSTTTNDDRKAKYRARRDAGASAYQALHAEWWKYPKKRPA